jgi:hypothetical protein
MKRNPVGWFEIYVQDMARAQAFYETVLGVTLSSLGPPELQMTAFPADMAAPGTGGALVKFDGMPSGGNSVLVYFSCDDCSVEGSRVGTAGGQVVREKMSIGEYGFIVLATDTEGNMFGLHSTQ